MVRKSLPLKKINDKRKRKCTFVKRRKGLFKKAQEFGILCGLPQVYVILCEESGHWWQYSSTGVPFTTSDEELLSMHLQGPSDIERDSKVLKVTKAGSATSMPLPHPHESYTEYLLPPIDPSLVRDLTSVYHRLTSINPTLSDTCSQIIKTGTPH